MDKGFNKGQGFMKRSTPKLAMYLGMLITAFNIGCAKENKNSDSSLLAPVTPDCSRGQCTGGNGLPGAPGGTGGGGSTYSGSSAALDVCGGVYDAGPSDCSASRKANALKGMFYNSIPNNPTNIQINIDNSRKTDIVVISYTDNGRVVEAGMGVQFPGGSRQNEQYNGWVTQTVGMASPGPVYKGFYQDQYGAIVLVIDKLLSDGDGQPAKIMAGSVWYQNFMDGLPGESACQSGDPRYGTCYVNQKMCWEISYGPYDCRTFLVNDAVNLISSLYPNNRGPTRSKSYVKLGNFSGISRAAAGL